MTATGGWLLGTILLSLALGMALGALMAELHLRNRGNEPDEVEPYVPDSLYPDMRQVTLVPEEPPTLAVAVTAGSPGNVVTVQRKRPDGTLFADAEEKVAYAYLHPGQYVRIDGDRAMPTPYPEGG